MNLEQALLAISQPIRASDLPDSLTPMYRLLEAIGNPQQMYPSVVVAGSVGKGTTCHQIATLMGDPLKVGLYTSPHLHSFRERFSINGKCITQTEFIAGVALIQQAISELRTPYSTFEMATALALWWFRKQAVDIAVLEIGIGGRFDAVNSAANTLAVITPIEREHAAMLGGTLASIASHKAGIIQPRGYAISTPQVAEVEAVLRHEARVQQAELSIEPIETLAAAACNQLMQRNIIPAFLLPATSPVVHFAGRMEQLQRAGKSWLIDGAHTFTSAERLRTEVERLAPEKSVRLIIGMLRDKSVDTYLSCFDDPRFQIVLTQAPSHRAVPAEELSQSNTLHHAHVCIQPDLQHALDETFTTTEDLIVITGSLRMAALAREFLGLLSTDEQEEARLTRHIFEGAAYLSKLK